MTSAPGVALLLAHFGHWYVSLPVFMGPVVVLFAWVYVGAWRQKRKERRGTRGRG